MADEYENYEGGSDEVPTGFATGTEDGASNFDAKDARFTAFKNTSSSALGGRGGRARRGGRGGRSGRGGRVIASSTAAPTGEHGLRPLKEGWASTEDEYGREVSPCYPTAFVYASSV